jgi:hypothetical protein
LNPPGIRKSAKSDPAKSRLTRRSNSARKCPSWLTASASSKSCRRKSGSSTGSSNCSYSPRGEINAWAPSPRGGAPRPERLRDTFQGRRQRPPTEVRLRQQSPNRPGQRDPDREEGHKLCILINEASMNWNMAPPLKNRERGLPSSLGSNSDALVVSVRSLTQYGR